MKASTAGAATAAAVLGMAGTGWSIPEVGSVNMTSERTLVCGYRLHAVGEAAIITLSIETNGVAIPDSAVTRLTGDVCKFVEAGTHSIVWNAGADWPEHTVTNARARVTAWSTNASPQYCVVDLTGGSSTDCYPVAYYTSAEALPYGGLTNAIYKSSYLVMRKIANGAFNRAKASARDTDAGFLRRGVRGNAGAVVSGDGGEALHFHRCVELAVPPGGGSVVRKYSGDVYAGRRGVADERQRVRGLVHRTATDADGAVGI
jgi:hypothetical protein